MHVVHVYKSWLCSSLLLNWHCRRFAVQQHARTLNLQLRLPCMFWDGKHYCTVYPQRMHTYTVPYIYAQYRKNNHNAATSSSECHKKIVVREESLGMELSVSARGEFGLSTIGIVCLLKNADVACVPHIFCLWQHSSDLEFWREHSFEFVLQDMSSFAPDIQCSLHPY